MKKIVLHPSMLDHFIRDGHVFLVSLCFCHFRNSGTRKGIFCKGTMNAKNRNVNFAFLWPLMSLMTLTALPTCTHHSTSHTHYRYSTLTVSVENRHDRSKYRLLTYGNPSLCRTNYCYRSGTVKCKIHTNNFEFNL